MRAKKAPKRTQTPDAKYNSVLVQKLINRSMRDGKRSVAAKQIYGAFDLIKETLGQDPLQVFEEVLRKVTPQMEVRSRRVGGASYQVPMPVRADRGQSLTIRWLVTEANKRPNKAYRSYAEKLAAEMLDALKEEGGAFAKRQATHRMADANKAFAHFRW